MLSTDCDGQDISNVDFGFDCEDDSPADKNGDQIIDVTWHSFGVGGFDAREEFDTGVQCARCLVASPPHLRDGQPKAKDLAAFHLRSSNAAAKPSHSRKRQTRHSRKVAARVPTAVPPVSGAISLARQARSDEVAYGPEDCVKLWKGTNGHCMMQTDCSKSNMTGYNYGLVCLDRNSVPTRHLFGENSFLPEETFDTLIACETCLGLEDLPDGVSLKGEVAALADDVKQIAIEVKNMSLDVKLLKTVVFPPAAPAPAPASSAPPESPAAGAVQLVRGHNRHRSHSHHHHQVESKTLQEAHSLNHKRSLRRAKNGPRNQHHRRHHDEGEGPRERDESEHEAKPKLPRKKVLLDVDDDEDLADSEAERVGTQLQEQHADDNDFGVESDFDE